MTRGAPTARASSRRSCPRSRARGGSRTSSRSPCTRRPSWTPRWCRSRVGRPASTVPEGADATVRLAAGRDLDVQGRYFNGLQEARADAMADDADAASGSGTSPSSSSLDADRGNHRRPGHGKSAVAQAFTTLLGVGGIEHGAIESEQLAWASPWLPDDLVHEQLAAVVRLKRGYGRRLFIVVATTETQADLDSLLAAIGAERSLVACLRAPATWRRRESGRANLNAGRPRRARGACRRARRGHPAAPWSRPRARN